MPDRPPPRLVDLLVRLGLASEAQVAALGRRVARLTRGLPSFDSAWVDAMVQTRILTAFQATQINAGRGEQLRVGPYVLCRTLDWPHFARGYLAREIQTGQAARLTVVESPPTRKMDVLTALEGLAARASDLESPGVAAVLRAGSEGRLRYVASRWVDGLSPAEWLVRHGRLRPEVVLEIARQMLVALVALEARGSCHGDLGSGSLVLTGEGQVVLLQPGVRAIVRPEESFAQAELQPEAYDYLAPERVSEGRPPTIQSDMFACGALWWHLLTGRAPLGSGAAVNRLRAAQECRIPDLSQWVPEVPRPLAEAIAACTSKDAAWRPESMSRLANMLGASTAAGHGALVRSLTGAERAPSLLVRSMHQATGTSRGSAWMTGAAVVLVVIGTLAATIWQFSRPRGDKSSMMADARVQAPASKELPRPRSDAPAKSPLKSTGMRPTEESGPADLVLSPGQIAWPTVRLAPGQKVRGHAEQRTQVRVPARGLTIDVDRLLLENIDFAWQSEEGGPERSAIIQLRSTGVRFRGCTFSPVSPGRQRASAIAWRLAGAQDSAALAMPSGQIQLVNCVMREVDAGVDCHGHAAVAVEMDNLLHVDAGPLVRLGDCPSIEETLVAALTRVTLRASGPLLECHYDRIPGQPGTITIRANQCVVLPSPGIGLLAFAGEERPDRLLAATQWTGQGSLVGPAVPIVVWQGPQGKAESLDGSGMAIHGLVCSEAAFAGQQGAGPAASRVTRWQVPLLSPDPPGIDPAELPALPLQSEQANGFDKRSL